MHLPMSPQILDGVSESAVHIAHENPDLVLGPVSMDNIAVTEAVGIVVADHTPPSLIIPDFQLHGESLDGLAAALVPAAKTSFVGRELDEPSSFCRFRRGHEAGL